jgi:hypothetical protein
MKEIDRLLKMWIPVNTIIRKEIRDAIVKVILKYNHPNNKSCLCELDYKQNTNEDG